MALILKDLNGNAYPVETVTNHTVRMNSDGMLTFNVIENEQTAHFINDISKMWRVENVTGDADAQAYVIMIAKRKATKHKQYIEVTAKEEQFDYLETHRIYENVTGSRTGVDFLNLIFDGTPYSYTLLEGVYAKEWENAGDGQSRFEMFLNWLERYGFEFQYEPTSKTFKLGARISRRPAYYISKKLNANDISFEEDATSFYTYAKGYFDYDGADNIHAANQIREYPKGKTSPMIELFGVREAPPVTDGRVTDKELMDEMLEKQVEQSLKMSIELDFVMLGHNYPFAQPEIGDEIPVIDETINFNRVLRIQEIKTTRDAHHKVIKQTIVVGDPKRETRYKKAQAGAASAINDLMAGRTKIKESVLPAAIKESTQMLMNTSSELSFSEQGIMAVDKDNPNYVTLLNSSGLGVSKDGGQTFHNAITRGQINANLITAGSINADYIRSGTLDANLVSIYGNGGHLKLAADGLKMVDNNGRERFSIDSLFVKSSALGTSNYNVYLGAKSGGEARVVEGSKIPGNGLIDGYDYLPVRASGYYGNFLNINPQTPGKNIYIRPLSEGELRVTLSEKTTNYQNIRAEGLYGNHVTVNSLQGDSDNLFMRPTDDGEVRVVKSGGTSDYRAVRASGYYGSFIDRGTENEGVHLYVRPGGDPGELRVTVRGTTSTYQPVRAKEFITDTSVRVNKKNTEVYDKKVEGIFRNMNVYEYNRLTDDKNTKKQLGAMIDELPSETHSSAGDSFGLYALISFVAKGVKEQIERSDSFEKRIERLEELENGTK